jgi:hypothetical protein
LISQADRGVLSDELGEAPIDEISAVSARDRSPWTLSFFADAVRMSGGAQVHVYSRRDVVERVKATPAGGAILLVLPAPAAPLSIAPAEVERLRRWMRPELGAWAAAEAKRTALIAIIGGAVCLLLWLLLGGWFLLAWGGFSLATGAAARLKPGAWAFVATAARSAIVSAVLLFDIVTGVISPWWALLILVMAFGVRGSIQKYRFFTRPIRDP